MPFIPAAIAAAATIYGATKQSGAQSRATDAQDRAYREAQALEQQQLDEQRRQWDALQEQRRPYREAGAQALGSLRELMSPAGQQQWRSPSQAGRTPWATPERRVWRDPRQVGTLGDLARRGQ